MSATTVVRFVRVSLTAATLALWLASPAMCQERFTMRFHGFNSVTPVADSSLLRFGRDPRATYCVDPYYFTGQDSLFTEYELPPLPPGFDVRSVRIPSRTGNGGCTGIASRDGGMSNDIRGYLSRTQVDTFQLNFQVGDVAPIHFTWAAGLGVFCDSAILRTVGGAEVETANMLTTQSFTPVDLDVATVRFFFYGAPAVGLVYPPNGVVVPQNVTLIWNAMPGATVYHLQVATDSLFTGLVVNDSTLAGVSRTMSGLALSVTYYWRVSAGNILGLGAYAPFRRFTTGNVPPAPTLLLPANGATGQPTTPALRWASSTGAQTYQVQVSTDQNFVTLVLNDSTITDTTRLVSPALSYGITYYWHVRGRNGVGPGSYSSPFSFTTQFQPPPAPTLVSPPNGQINTPVAPTLTWNAVSGTVTYRLQVSTNAGFTGIVVDDSLLTTTSRTIGPLQNNTQYFWHVNASNAGGPGSYSTTFNFTTIILPPPAPVLVSPPDGAVNVSLLPTMTWYAAPTSASYHLQVARDSAFGVLVVDDSSITGTTKQIGQLTSSTLYYWKVRGKNVGGIGPYSPVFRFTTTQAPPSPALLWPADSATRVSSTPTFVWERVASATSYTLQIATEPTFTPPLMSDTTITDTEKTVDPLPYGSILLWRVRAKNSSGPSLFSSPRVFTVMLEPPGITYFISPTNNLFNAPATMTLKWANVPLATGFQLQVAFDTLMTNLIVNDTSLADTFKIVNLPPSTAIYWRVRAHNTENNYGPYYYVRRFTTANVPPAIPVPTFPVNGDTGVTRNVCLQWTSIPGALTYRAQVSLNLSFTQIIADDTSLTSSSFCPPTLPPLVTCFWRVRSKGYWGWSQCSAPFTFTTGLATPVGEDPGSRQPLAFALQQNYPNPFNPSTTIPFEILNGGFVSLRVYDVLGREIRTLVNGDMPAGTYSARWNGESDNGQPVPSGMYFVRMVAGDSGTRFSAVRKLMLVK